MTRAALSAILPAIAVAAMANPAAAQEVDRPMGAKLETGDAAPPFTLVGSDGETYSLSQFRGKQAVVLAWFPKANTPG